MPHSRRELLLRSLAFPLLGADKKAAPPPPNILLILADGVGSWMLGCFGNKDIRTPNIDLLARGGARFANHYAASPIGSANRATLFTGRLPSQHGVFDEVLPPSFASETMLFDALAAQNYNCGYVGKWDLGAQTTPQHHCSFWKTVTGGLELVTGNGAGFLDAQTSQKPFFLTVSYFNTLDDYPARYAQMYAKSTFESMGRDPVAPNAREKETMKDIVPNLRKAAAAITALDDQIPALRTRLQARGLADNTLIIFSSVAGALLGRHGLWSDGLASDPVNMFDEVTRVPMIWNWAGRIPVESVRNEMVSAYDAMPSICELTGAAAAPNLMGRSYVPLALARPLPKKHPWRNALLAESRNIEMIRDSRYKLVLRNQGKGPNELYDLNVDPRERLNRYYNPSYISVRDQLKSLYGRR